MKRIIKLSLLSLLTLFSSNTVFAQKRVVVQGDNVCIRNSATLDADNKMGHENKGASFSYLGTYGDFLCIDYHGYYGYIHKRYGMIVGETTAAAMQKMVYVKGKGVRVRTAPSLQGKVVGSVNWGDAFECLGHQDGWFEIRYKGQTCYISDQFSSTEEN